MGEFHLGFRSEQALRRSFFLAVLALALSGLAGCLGVERKKGGTDEGAAGLAASTVGECAQGPDQGNTYVGKDKNPAAMSRWFLSGPIVLALKIDNPNNPFTVAERNALISAGEKWNAFSRAVYGGNFFDLRGLADNNPPVELPLSDEALCSIDLRLGDVLRDRISIYKVTSNWPSNQSNVIGVTTSCSIVSEGLRSGMWPFSNAAMRLNFQYFWASGKKKPDLETIFMHELGHMLGLDHSCEASRIGYPSCANSNPDYSKSFMNYQVRFDSSGNGIPNATIDANAQGRTNCIYKR